GLCQATLCHRPGPRTNISSAVTAPSASRGEQDITLPNACEQSTPCRRSASVPADAERPLSQGDDGLRGSSRGEPLPGRQHAVCEVRMLAGEEVLDSGGVQLHGQSLAHSLPAGEYAVIGELEPREQEPAFYARHDVQGS